MANLNCFNSVIDAGLPRDVTAETVAIESVAMPYPVFAYTRDVDEIFVIGGTSSSCQNFNAFGIFLSNPVLTINVYCHIIT